MNWDTKVLCPKRNPATVAQQINYIFKELWVKVILNVMHPIGQILNFDDRDYQDRGTEHFHATFYVEGAPKVNEDKDSKVIEFIDQYITCSVPRQSK